MYSFGKKIEKAFKGSKSLKITKTHFQQKLTNEAFAKNCFDLKTIFLKHNLK